MEERSSRIRRIISESRGDLEILSRAELEAMSDEDFWAYVQLKTMEYVLDHHASEFWAALRGKSD